MPLVLAGVEGPVRGDQVDGDQRPVQDEVGVPGPRRVPGPPCAASAPGAASSATVSSTYRQAVAVPTPNPAARLANVSPLHR